MVRAPEDSPDDATLVKCSKGELFVVAAFLPFEQAGHLKALWLDIADQRLSC